MPVFDNIILPDFPEPSTARALEDARLVLNGIEDAVTTLSIRIEDREAILARIIRGYKEELQELQEERSLLQEKAYITRAYLSPIRRLPAELLGDIFLWLFEEHPCSAWVMSTVCKPWRRLALGMPRLWSKIRLVTTPHSSPDTIRLWLERSGDNVPLDIEIFLRVGNSKQSSSDPTLSRSRRRRSSSPLSPLPWAYPNGGTPNSIPPPAPPPGLAIIPPAHTPLIVPPSPGTSEWTPGSRPGHEKSSSATSKTLMHWGHITFYYLVEHMHRWERFIFRFDKIFTSIRALKSISGPAPLLKEFEVSCAEAGYYPESWAWLPSDSVGAVAYLPRLQSLTLHYTPFEWSSAALRTGLTTLNLRALPNCHLPLDRILSIVAGNPTLCNLSLYFENVLPAILPLTMTTLNSLKTLSIGGHFHLAQLVDFLTVPNLTTLNFDIDARDAMEDVITNLLTRSHAPPVAHLSIGYSSATPAPAFYIGQVFVVVSWPALLSELPYLKSFHIGGTPLEALAMALGSPDDESNHIDSWNCMRLETLGLRNCHTHSEGVTKLVQMVEARNPGRIAHRQNGPSSQLAHQSASSIPSSSTFSSSASIQNPSNPFPLNPTTQTTTSVDTTTSNLTHPVKLKALELHDCSNVGQDVIRWLRDRVENVICSDSTNLDRWVIHPLVEAFDDY